MIAFFPEIYEDELLYSVLARYHLRSDNLSTKRTLLDLFGSKTVIATSDIPSSLGVLSERLDGVITPEELISKNTLLPYYSPFLEIKRVDSIRREMIGQGGGALHTRIGIMASSVKTPNVFRYCPSCVTEDEKNYGEAYWHRLHQLPGVVVCPKHLVYLKESKVRLHVGNRHEFIAIKANECDLSSERVDTKDWLSFNLVEAAKYSEWLLRNEPDPVGLEVLNCNYLAYLTNGDWVSPGGHIRFQDLINDIVSFYGKSILTFFQSKLSINQQDNWLHKILRKPRTSAHPLRHFLLLRFMGKDYGQLFCEEIIVAKPFGQGPWPCLNHAASHLREFVVKDCRITRCCDTGRPVGTFSCSCGFVYSRRGPDKTADDLFKRGRVKEFGPIWEEYLRELSQNGKISFRQIASKLGVDTNTVIHYLDADHGNRKDKANVYTDPSSYRNKWLEQFRLHPNCTRTELRRLGPAVYTWLYRNDREWLFSHLPPKQVPVHYDRKNEVDWDQRDQELAGRIAEAIPEILTKVEKPVRITASRVGDEIGKRALLQKHLNKLPRCQSLLNKYVESVEQFQVRRVRQAADRIRRGSDTVKRWRVLKMAGLEEKKLCTAVNEVLSEECDDRWEGCGDSVKMILP